MTTLKLKPEIKARFVEALRSRKYAQGKYNLRHQDKFCCLGVLGDLAVQDGLASWSEDQLIVNGSCYGALFPEQLLAWACESNVTMPNGETTFPLPDSEEDSGACLVYANDDLGQTFPEIACLIEKYL